VIAFTVAPENGEPYELTATSRDVLMWEKTTHGWTFLKLMEEMPMVQLYKLAHLAARRQQMFTGPLEEFEKTCELKFERTEADPTQPGLSPGD
jgi:hypothetical protein